MVTALLAATLSFAQAGGTAPYVWIEGESPTSSTLAVESAGWGKTDWLSEGKFGRVEIPADQIAAKLPDSGAVINYTFQTTAAGASEIWNRIGFEFVRSTFDWRVDNGDWRTIKPDDLTTDMQELSTWFEMAWIKLGDANLTAGAHTLQIRLPKTKNAKGEWERVLYASDALVVSNGPFRPNGKFRPDASHQTGDGCCESPGGEGEVSPRAATGRADRRHQPAVRHLERIKAGVAEKLQKADHRASQPQGGAEPQGGYSGRIGMHLSRLDAIFRRAVGAI
jgi:hypothetical protein